MNPIMNAKQGIEVDGRRLNTIFENVCDLDMSSLYPSIILALMIEPSNQLGKITLRETEDGYDLGGDVASDIASGDFVKFCSKWLNMPSKDEILGVALRKGGK
jgi:hypothetical protein